MIASQPGVHRLPVWAAWPPVPPGTPLRIAVQAVDGLDCELQVLRAALPQA